ncbi:MAG: hypothetical protein R3345_08260 [Fulvivirga sp.]|nr:hypothetical protein [Fulvivirga sp.]
MLAVNDIVVETTGASAIEQTNAIQNLWSGYGEIKRYILAGGRHKSVIVKHIVLPSEKKHPRGWNTNLSHQRKLKSYQVECNWYQNYAYLTDLNCKMPQCFHTEEAVNEMLLIMEDLDASGYPYRETPESVTLDQAKNCLSWLAHFHAKFMERDPDGLWPIGTYWHLETRPDEWEQMTNLSLKQAARAIDATVRWR